MADVIKTIERAEDSLPHGGAIYHGESDFPAGGEDPQVYHLPPQQISGPSVLVVTGSPVVQVTNYPAGQITTTYDATKWATWDGTSQFSPGITAIRVSAAATAKVSLSVRTATA